MPDMTLAATDAAELAQLLQIIGDWFTYDHDCFGASPLSLSATAFLTPGSFSATWIGSPSCSAAATA